MISQTSSTRKVAGEKIRILKDQVITNLFWCISIEPFHPWIWYPWLFPLNWAEWWALQRLSSQLVWWGSQSCVRTDLSCTVSANPGCQQQLERLTEQPAWLAVFQLTWITTNRNQIHTMINEWWAKMRQEWQDHLMQLTSVDWTQSNLAWFGLEQVVGLIWNKWKVVLHFYPDVRMQT